jgi:formiminotetrahydrofolate cyclodeaminase
VTLAALLFSEVLERLGERTPAPASGSAAALTGALAAALVELSARFSEDEEALARARELGARLVALADEDAEAYAAYMRTRSDADRNRTIDVPLAVAEAAAETAALAERLAEHGNRSVAGDALVAAELAHAAARSAVALVELNRADGSRL